MNNDLDADTCIDQGAFETFGTSRFVGTVNVPSLRNIGVRAPYMHDVGSRLLSRLSNIPIR